MTQKNQTYKPVALIILDGWGIAPPSPGNAVKLAKTPFFDRLWTTYPHTQLEASGEAVGLPGNEMGTSEVGHLNIGAGRIVWQDVSKINKAIKDGSFFKNPALLKACRRAKNSNTNLHLIGLVGGGVVHASLDHLLALLDLCARENLPKESVKIHIFTDGRDSPPKSALIYLKQLEVKMKEIKIGEIASVTGRYWAMDRDRRWERTDKAYDALTWGRGKKASSAEEAIELAYTRGETDEFIRPTIIEPQRSLVKTNDAVIFFNFRADRARQLTKAFILPRFDYFKREVYPKNLFFVSLVECEKDIPVSASAFTPHRIEDNLTQVISRQGKTQLHIAESEKYAYITYYFNGGIETPYPGEDRVVIPSPKVSTYDKSPEMSALKIADGVGKSLQNKDYAFVLVNFANPDMLGHTGIIPAAIKGIEAADNALKKIVEPIMVRGGTSIVTADHGNAEEMVNPQTGEVSTSHSKNPVPFILIRPEKNSKPLKIRSGILADIAPTVLKLMGIPKPKQMTGKSLI